jgi:hypothetical protein
VIPRSPDIGAFQFVVLATLRAAQLIRGCRPRVDGAHKTTVTAQFEVAEGRIRQVSSAPTSVAGSASAAVVLQQRSPTGSASPSATEVQRCADPFSHSVTSPI